MGLAGFTTGSAGRPGSQTHVSPDCQGKLFPIKDGLDFVINYSQPFNLDLHLTYQCKMVLFRFFQKKPKNRWELLKVSQIVNQQV